MILRRLAASFRKQDWFTVMVELMIVTVGIGLGLQANEWADRRAELRDEERTLARLDTELAAAMELRDTTRRSAGLQVEHLYTVRKMLFGFEPARALTGRECQAIWSSHWMPLPADGIPSLDELIATGRMHILSSEPLRRAALDLLRARERAERIVSLHGSAAPNLSVEFPELVRAGLTRTDDPDDLDGFDPNPECDVVAMKEDLAFLSAFSANVAAFNTYITEGFLRPNAAFKRFEAALRQALTNSRGEGS